MAGPTAWQLGEELKGRLLPVLREIRELKSRIHLEISHKRDEIEFGSVLVRRNRSPEPEDPKKMKKLSESVIGAITEAIGMYEQMCHVEATGEYHVQQETGQVSTTCGDDEDLECQRPTPEVGPAKCPLDTEMETMDTAVAAGFGELESAGRCSSDRPRLYRSLAVENEESVDLGQRNRNQVLK